MAESGDRRLDPSGIVGRPTLLEWALATVDASLFVLIAVAAAHGAGRLSDLLAGTGTVLGVAAFLYLWLLAVAGIEWVLSAASLSDSRVRWLALRAFVAGGLVGGAFFLGLLAVAVVPATLTGDFPPIALALYGLIGTGLAVVVGGVVGLVAGLLDLAAYRLAERVTPNPARARDRQ